MVLGGGAWHAGITPAAVTPADQPATGLEPESEVQTKLMERMRWRDRQHLLLLSPANDKRAAWLAWDALLTVCSHRSSHLTNHHSLPGTTIACLLCLPGTTNACLLCLSCPWVPATMSAAVFIQEPALQGVRLVRLPKEEFGNVARLHATLAQHPRVRFLVAAEVSAEPAGLSAHLESLLSELSGNSLSPV